MAFQQHTSFQAPQPTDAWPGIRDALVEGAVCPQLDALQGLFYKGDEDCLFLNVYTCQVKRSTRSLSFKYRVLEKQRVSKCFCLKILKQFDICPPPQLFENKQFNS
jgi:hypothetical protein